MKTSLSGSSEVYAPTWTFFDKLSFGDLTLDVNKSLTTLGVVKSPKKLKVAEDKKVEAEKGKIELWKALTSLHKFSPQVVPSNDDNIAYPAHAPTLVERANSFSKVVADNLLECDPKDWSMLRKCIFDMFFEYEQQKSLSIHASLCIKTTDTTRFCISE